MQKNTHHAHVTMVMSVAVNVFVTVAGDWFVVLLEPNVLVIVMLNYVNEMAIKHAGLTYPDEEFLTIVIDGCHCLFDSWESKLTVAMTMLYISSAWSSVLNQSLAYRGETVR